VTDESVKTNQILDVSSVVISGIQMEASVNFYLGLSELSDVSAVGTFTALKNV
jgi:hypothetical protein